MAANGSGAPQPRVALLAGASGLTGNALLRQLLRDNAWTRVLALSRRPLPLEHARLANRILQFSELVPVLKGQHCTHAFCALGAAGGPRAAEAELRAVDLQLVLDFAHAALAAGATRLVVISAAGADQRAGSVFLRVKGELESALRPLRFDGIDILQPGIVFGARRSDGVGDVVRHATLAILSPLLRRSSVGPTSLSCEQLATAMATAARSQRIGVHCYAGSALSRLTAAPLRKS